LKPTINTSLMLALIAGCLVLRTSGIAVAQTQRYTPSKPTVSPYLNLFQNNRDGRGFNSAVPNYYSLVRPQLQQLQTNQNQQRTIQQQANTIGQLQGNVQLLQQAVESGQSNVLTGHGSWFGNPGQQSRFLNTSSYYARAGAGAPQRSGNRAASKVSRPSVPSSRPKR
jgi:hypothetical protein